MPSARCSPAGSPGRRWPGCRGATSPQCSPSGTRAAACSIPTASRRSARPSPASRRPRPAPRSLRPDEVVAAAVEEAELLDEQLLALVAVSRPADVPAAVGWAGAGEEWDAATVSAVLRTWEDRFGAVLVRMGRATLELAVAAPPWERSECLAIAAEHYAFCDDTYRGNPGTLRDYANLLRGSTRWSFWWD